MKEKNYVTLEVVSIYMKDKLEAEKLCAEVTDLNYSDILNVSYFYNQYGKNQDTHCVEIIFGITEGEVILPKEFKVNNEELQNYGIVEVKSWKDDEVTSYLKNDTFAVLELKTVFKSNEEEYRFVSYLKNAEKFGGALANTKVSYKKEDNLSVITVISDALSYGTDIKVIKETLEFYGDVSVEYYKMNVKTCYVNDNLLYRDVVVVEKDNSVTAIK